MTVFHPALNMRNQYDIGGYSGDGQLILIGEIKKGHGATEESAKVFRRNLIAHNLLPRDVYFLFANRTAIYLWKPQASDDASPDFKADAEPVLKRFLGEPAENDSAPGAESLEFAFKHWLSNFVQGFGNPEAASEADRMLLEAGLYPKLKGGEIRHELAA